MNPHDLLGVDSVPCVLRMLVTLARGQVWLIVRSLHGFS